MSKPSAKRCAVVIEHNEFSIRLSRVGNGPLVSVWVSEHSNGGRGIILDVAQSDEFIEGWQEVLDQIDNEAAIEAVFGENS